MVEETVEDSGQAESTRKCETRKEKEGYEGDGDKYIKVASLWQFVGCS